VTVTEFVCAPSPSPIANILPQLKKEDIEEENCDTEANNVINSNVGLDTQRPVEQNTVKSQFTSNFGKVLQRILGNNRAVGNAQSPFDFTNVASPEAKNFCSQFSQLPLGDGSQKTETGDCSLLSLGSLPSVDNMVSTLIKSPEDGFTIQAGINFTAVFDVANMELGHFSDPKKLYYTEPQTLNAKGQIKGHLHLTIQKLAGSANEPLTPPDAKTFAFFKGLDFDPSPDARTLSFEVPGLKEAGFYRLCSITGANTHQPTLMPAHLRGVQDDCIRFTVS
jgi:hypothetical protein